MKKNALFFLLLLLTVALVWATLEVRPLSFDDFIRIKRVSDLQISPAGDLIAFVVTEMNKEKNSSNSDIWILSTDGGKPWRLTSSPGSDFNPRWFPDGRRIAFISTRGDTAQIWVIDPHGGEAAPLSDISTGVSGFIWSPTETRLAFSSSVFPDCTDDECNKRRDEEEEKSEVKAKIFEYLPYRHWNDWRKGKRSHLFILSSEGGKAHDVTPGDYDAPPISLSSDHDYAISPDGKEMCFVRNIDPEFRISLGTNNDLFVTSIDGGQIEKITTNKANDNSPQYSPDVRFIAYRAMARAGFEADKYSLMLYEKKNKKITNMTEALDRSVDDILWSADSSSIFFTFEEKGRRVLARIFLKDRKIERLLGGHYVSNPNLSPDGETIYLLKQAIHYPSEIYSLDIQSETLKKLTDINGALLQRIEMNPVEEFWFEGAEGDNIHGFLVKPP